MLNHCRRNSISVNRITYSDSKVKLSLPVTNTAHVTTVYVRLLRSTEIRLHLRKTNIFKSMNCQVSGHILSSAKFIFPVLRPDGKRHISLQIRVHTSQHKSLSIFTTNWTTLDSAQKGYSRSLKTNIQYAILRYQEDALQYFSHGASVI